MIQIEQVPAYMVWPIRHKVMYPDKDFESIKLKEDENGIHLALFDENELISVVSVFKEGHSLQFRKLATLEQHQGKGYGSQLMQYVIEFSEKQNALKLWCNARESALQFYTKFGFEETGERFYKDGIKFVVMALMLKSINE